MGFHPPADPREYILEKDVSAFMRGQYVGEAGQLLASSRTTPCDRSLADMPDGTWKIDEYKALYGHEVSVLRTLDPKALLLSESEVEMNIGGRGDDAARYAEWMAQGKTPPPIECVEITDGTGRIKVTNGHRRTAAACALGKQIRAWVSPVMPHPDGLIDSSTNKSMFVGLTYEAIHGKSIEPMIQCRRLTSRGELLDQSGRISVIRIQPNEITIEEVERELLAPVSAREKSTCQAGIE